VDKPGSIEEARQRMVEEQLAGRDIADRRVLDAMGSVPREAFVPPDLAHLAYADAPLPIGFRQTISQPYIVALMIQLACLGGEETVLEVGTGSGYQAAVLARLARCVYTVEYIPELAKGAQETLARLGVRNVEVITGDGSRGLPEHAPYHAILVAAAAPRAPGPLKEQLTDGGFLIIPVGDRDGQILERWKRRGENTFRERITGVAFVPLCGQHGWETDDGPGAW
jgi:protein-L-isoaspartate(D-aspartate) O-methyltransferase